MPLPLPRKHARTHLPGGTDPLAISSNLAVVHAEETGTGAITITSGTETDITTEMTSDTYGTDPLGKFLAHGVGAMWTIETYGYFMVAIRTSWESHTGSAYVEIGLSETSLTNNFSSLDGGGSSTGIVARARSVNPDGEYEQFCFPFAIASGVTFPVDVSVFAYQTSGSDKDLVITVDGIYLGTGPI